MLRKEAEYLRGEVTKERKDGDMLRRQVEMSNMKCDLIFQEMLRHVEQSE